MRFADPPLIRRRPAQLATVPSRHSLGVVLLIISEAGSGGGRPAVGRGLLGRGDEHARLLGEQVRHRQLRRPLRGGVTALLLMRGGGEGGGE